MTNSTAAPPMRLALAGLALLASTGAQAIVGGSGIDSNDLLSPWAGVGSLSIGGGTYSGALVSDRYVLTAAHVVSGRAPGSIQFNLNVDGSVMQTFAAEAVFVYSGYAGTAAGTDGVWHDDLALVRLAAPVQGGIPAYALSSAPLGLGETITLVGYGAGGTGGSTPANPNVKRVGQNVVDRLLTDDDVTNGADEVFMFDFDGQTDNGVWGAGTLGADVEAGFAGGDSGAPVFVQRGGIWLLAGIGAFNGSSTAGGSKDKFGAVGGGTVVASYQDWIQGQISAVPEADTWALLMAGLAGVGFAASGRRRSV